MKDAGRTAKNREGWRDKEALWFLACESASPADMAAGFQALSPAGARGLLGNLSGVRPVGKMNARAELALSKAAPLQVGHGGRVCVGGSGMVCSRGGDGENRGGEGEAGHKMVKGGIGKGN